MKTCVKCGNSMPDNAKICLKCGTPVPTDTDPAEKDIVSETSDHAEQSMITDDRSQQPSENEESITDAAMDPKYEEEDDDDYDYSQNDFDMNPSGDNTTASSTTESVAEILEEPEENSIGMDPATDPFYDSIKPEIENEVYKIPKDIFIKGLLAVALVIVIIIWLLFMVSN